MTGTGGTTRRSAAFGLTTTGMVVLMAMVAAASAADPGTVTPESRRIGEARTVRVVAAAMAAARDFVGSEAAPMALAVELPLEADWAPRTLGTTPTDRRPPGPATLLGPRRLDLPPPTLS